jgi:SAM-dependent methyltransferase
MGVGSYIIDYLLTLSPLFPGNEGRSMLELGEAEARPDAATALANIARIRNLDVNRLQNELEECRRGDPAMATRLEARAIYRWTLGQSSYRAIDLGSTEPAWRQDLNRPFDLGARFDIVVNNGTSEHIFDQANVFVMMHEHTKPGGHMIHFTCGLGWIDHGFYNVQPHFFFDLAKYNDYDVLSCVFANEQMLFPLTAANPNPPELETDPRFKNALICCCLRRRSDAPFRFPTQYPYQN